MRRRGAVACLSTLILSLASFAQELSTEIQQANAIFANRCASCHAEGSSEDVEATKWMVETSANVSFLVDNKLIRPGEPATSSYLYQRVLRGEMPPGATKLDEDEIRILATWIESLQPKPVPVVSRTDKDILASILQDLKTLDGETQAFVRYVSLEHYRSAGLGREETNVATLALAKLVNSLSWSPEIALPKAVDPSRSLVFRLNLRDYLWSRDQWEESVADRYPYYPYYSIAENDPVLNRIQKAMDTEVPFVRADWFIAAASRPPVYYDLLAVPTTLQPLETTLRVDSTSSYRDRVVLRAGFNNSRIAHFNRIVERQAAVTGAYWRSFDFSSNAGEKNIFERPLGPRSYGEDEIERTFVQDGGEVIFSLPNGLQGYVLVNANDERIDKALTSIVSDKTRPDGAVVAGLSCMWCHQNGLNRFDDRVRKLVVSNRAQLEEGFADSVASLYPAKPVLEKKLERDKSRFMRAMAQLSSDGGLPKNGGEPVLSTVQNYERDMGVRRLIAELGVKADQAESLNVHRNAGVTTLLRQLAADVEVKRQSFEQAQENTESVVADLNAEYLRISDAVLLKRAELGIGGCKIIHAGLCKSDVLVDGYHFPSEERDCSGTPATSAKRLRLALKQGRCFPLTPSKDRDRLIL